MLRHIRNAISASGHPRRAALLLACFCLVAAVGGSYAYLHTVTLPVANTIVLGDVQGKVEESIENGEKTNVSIRNTGSLAAYIRVKTLASYRQGDAVLAKIPRPGTDYTIQYTTDPDWVQGADSYWYYRKPVAPGGTTSVLVVRCVPINLAAGQAFQLDILTSLLQAGAPQAVASWSNSATTLTVGADGLLTITGTAKGGGE